LSGYVGSLGASAFWDLPPPCCSSSSDSGSVNTAVSAVPTVSVTLPGNASVISFSDF